MELIIYSRKGQSFKVLYDECDCDLVNRYTWHVTKKHYGYVRTTIIKSNGRKQYLLLHREILGLLDKTLVVDHKNGNTLDNSRGNLRIATPSQNGMNRKPCGLSKYIGVCKSTGRNKWQATIKANGKYKMLGRFDKEEEAAISYDKAAKLYHGEFANLNFPMLDNVTLPKLKESA